MKETSRMQIPVYVSSENGHFVARTVGACDFSAAGPTREEAVYAIAALLAREAEAGQLLNVEVKADPLMQMAGKYRDDPWLPEIVEEIYRLRDEEQAAVQ
jgi:hypothetical protein